MVEPAPAGSAIAPPERESRAARVRREAKRAWRRLRGGELSPARAAASVAVGLLIGLTPLYGLHLFVVLLVCVPLRLDAPLAYLAANVSIPLVSPFIVLGEIEVGAFARTGHGVALDVATLRAQGPWSFARDLVVGTALAAPVVAILGGLATFALTTRAERARAQRRQDPLLAAADAVALRYAPGRRAAYYYVRGKLAADPVVRALFDLGRDAPLGEVVDVGCGRGQIALLLLVAGIADRVRGYDWDARKIADAERAGRGLEATFAVASAEDEAIAPADTVLLIDVLHYLDDETQDALLDRVAAAARRTVVVRELDPDRGIRSTLTRLEEWAATRTRVNRGAIHLRPVAALTARLEQRGFACRVAPCWAGTPFSNVLVVATRTATT